jgi:N-acetyl-beta-hexosaminidase
VAIPQGTHSHSLLFSRGYSSRYTLSALLFSRGYSSRYTLSALLFSRGYSSRYTLSELQELQDFAAERGVTIIGEMDVPGHSAALVSAMPDTFGWPSQGSHSPGIVNFVNDTVVKSVQVLFDEISNVFPSAYVHMGGDEVNFGALNHLPEVRHTVC